MNSVSITDKLAPKENVESLRAELARHYKNESFLACQTMGELLRLSFQQVIR
jgi:hypothetical protein